MACASHLRGKRAGQWRIRLNTGGAYASTLGNHPKLAESANHLRPENRRGRDEDQLRAIRELAAA